MPQTKDIEMDILDSCKNSIFLLGGHDLEMLEIREILVNKGLKFYDENLGWDNAKLSKYVDKLNNVDSFVGIELAGDINPPKNYQLIDHHNKNAERPSAIEQVAVLLGMNLTHGQLLVAANDKGYILAMEEMGATKEEVAEIRKRDREAQGVTEEDERLAEKSINENTEQKGDVFIVNSLTDRFSTITDRMWGKANQLLIYNNDSITYYGSNIERLIHIFTGYLDAKNAYYGGNPLSFFGIDLKKIQKEEKESIINKFKTLIDGKN